MIRIPLTPEDIKLAEQTFKNKNDNIEQWAYNRDGNLGEIAFCKWVNQVWTGKPSADNGVDVYWMNTNQTVQVKTVRDEPQKKKFWIEQKPVRFDYYAFMFLAQDMSYAELVWIADKDTIECNAVTDSHGLKHLWYKPHE